MKRSLLWALLGFCLFPFLEWGTLGLLATQYGRRVDRMLMFWLHGEPAGRTFDPAHGAYVPVPPLELGEGAEEA